MATKAAIEKWLLEHCTTSRATGCVDGTGLTQLHQKVFGHRKNVAKAEAAHDLATFYANEQYILDIWNGSSSSLFQEEGLNEAEKAFISTVVQFNGVEHKPTSKKIAAEFGLNFMQDSRKYHSYSSRNPFDDDYNFGEFYLIFLHLLKQHYPHTKATILFPGGKIMPPFVLDVMKPIVPAFEYYYSEFKPSGKNYVICRENRVNDFAAIVRFSGGEQLKTKEYTLDITKAKLAKMVESVGFDEICDNNGKFCLPKDAVRINDFKVAPFLFALAANIGLLDIDHAGLVKPGKKAISLLANQSHEFAKMVFESYVGTSKISEIHYVTYVSLHYSERPLDWGECRKPIIDLLKTCPTAKWIKFEDFEKYMSIFHGNFFRKLLRYEVSVKGFDFGYDHFGRYYPEWDECEVQIIMRTLSILGAIGMLDIAYKENLPRFKYIGDAFCVGIEGFRVTPLGSWILGLTNAYEPTSLDALQSEEGGLVVQPDHSIIITGLRNRVEHESFLSSFLTKLSSEDNASIYKIDFQSMVRALNSGIKPREIEKYLAKASSHPLPENVLRSFSDWQSKVGKVKIRRVTLLEADQASLLEELIHASGMEKLLGDKIKHAVVITKDEAQKRVKSIIEKNGWLVTSIPPKSSHTELTGRQWETQESD